jgi:formate dehydrogenase subunit delta
MGNSHKLIQMINQIAINLEARGQEEAISETAMHLRKFWSAQMLEDLFQLHGADESEFREVSSRAVKVLQSNE